MENRGWAKEGTSSRRRGDSGQPEGGDTAGRTKGGRPKEVVCAPQSPRARERCLDGEWPGRGVACGLVPPTSTAPAAARPAGVRPECTAELGPSLRLSDLAMASLQILLCLCVAAAHLAGTRGEAPPDPRPAP